METITQYEQLKKELKKLIQDKIDSIRKNSEIRLELSSDGISLLLKRVGGTLSFAFITEKTLNIRDGFDAVAHNIMKENFDDIMFFVYNYDDVLEVVGRLSK